MKTIKTFKKVLLVSLLPCALASTQSIAANIVDPLVSNVGPESDVPVAVQTLRWHMLDRDVNSLSFRSMDTLFDTRQVARAGDISKLVKSEQPMT